VTRLLTEIRLLDVTSATTIHNGGVRPELESFLSTMLGALPALSDSIAQRYFSHTAAARQLGAGPAESL